MPDPQQVDKWGIPLTPDISLDRWGVPGVAPPSHSSPPPEGFMESFLPHALMHPKLAYQEERQQEQAHPKASLVENAFGPVIPSLYRGAKRIGSEVVAGGKDLIHGNTAGAIVHGVNAIPIAGPAMIRAAEQTGQKPGENYSSSLKDVVTNPGAMGTLTGAAAQIAPLVLGGVDAASPNRSLFGEIPTRAKAGKLFDSLNTNMANTPVPLNEATPPLQSMDRYAQAGAPLPKPASKLLSHSKTSTSLDYPEARRFQETLGQLSRNERMSLNGSQGGNLKLLNKGLYSDILDAADTAGYGGDYTKAMNMYRRASQINSGLRTAAKIAIPAAATLAGGGALVRYLRPLVNR